jgi:hypothetical protein
MRTISNPVGTPVLRAIDPALQLVVFSTSNVVEVVKWRSAANDLRLSISLQTDDLEEMVRNFSRGAQLLTHLSQWNGTIDVRLVTPYILVFKTRSVELYPLTPMFAGTHTESDTNYVTASPHLPRLVHRFSSTTFRDISCSDLLPSTDGNSKGTKSIRLCFLADDVLQGVFQYMVHIRYPITSYPTSLASLDVDCIGVYAMANNINLAAVRPLRANNKLTSPLLATTAESPAPSPISTPSPTPQRPSLPGLFGHSTAHGVPNPSSRGFVSAVALGPQGKRAVWVERKRGSTMREVFVWGMDQGFDDKDLFTQNIEMDGKVVYTVGSYDLRGDSGHFISASSLLTPFVLEDLTHCAIGEVSGLIILGNRAGDVFRLGLERG